MKSKKAPTNSMPRVTWQELAAQQGTKPIPDLDKFMEEFGDPCPDETADEMIAGIRALRRQCGVRLPVAKRKGGNGK